MPGGNCTAARCGNTAFPICIGMLKGWRFTAEGEKLLENVITRLGLSARAHDHILKVARTIADLEATENIAGKHLSEAIQYRTLDCSYWA